MPVVVEAIRNVELEARRARQHDAAARMHQVDLLAHGERILHAQELERVAVGNKQDAALVGHAQAL